MRILLKTISCLAISASALAGGKIAMYSLKSAKPHYIGYISAQDTRYGLLLTPHLSGLPAGVHGFHVHAVANCGQHGMQAGGHLDPLKTGKHLGPYDPRGHLGDLPVLYVNAQGQSHWPVLAPRLTFKQIRGHSLMIHVGGDNYSDQPVVNGGGGARLACGVVH